MLLCKFGFLLGSFCFFELLIYLFKSHNINVIQWLGIESSIYINSELPKCHLGSFVVVVPFIAGLSYRVKKNLVCLPDRGQEDNVSLGWNSYPFFTFLFWLFWSDSINTKSCMLTFDLINIKLLMTMFSQSKY